MYTTLKSYLKNISSIKLTNRINISFNNISIHNKQIQQVNKSKALVTIDDQHLSWKPNTENICKKITSGTCQTIYC